MALQQLTLTKVNNTGWLKKPAATVMCLVVAGLFFIAMLFNGSCTNAPRQQTAIHKTKQASECQCSSTCPTKAKQPAEASTFSIMPGGLSRFLQ